MPGLALYRMFSSHEEPIFDMILHKALPNVALETFIRLPGRNMAKVFKVFKDASGHFLLGQKSWGK